MIATPRALYGAVRLPGATEPFDRAHFRLTYPAALDANDPEQRQTGRIPPDLSLAPWPLAVLIGGINVSPDGYRWLAARLATSGIASVSYSFVEELAPGGAALSPGLDVEALRPGVAGTRPSASVLAPLFDAVDAQVQDGLLAEAIDTLSAVLVGHSAGATTALLNARSEWFPRVRGVVSYAGHTVPAAMLGHPPGTVLPLDPTVPALMLGGRRDGVIDASVGRYHQPDDPTPHDPVRATFATAGAGSVMAMLRDGTHLTWCHPEDGTSARGFLESTDARGTLHREVLGDLVAAFVRRTCRPSEGGATSAFEGALRAPVWDEISRR